MKNIFFISSKSNLVSLNFLKKLHSKFYKMLSGQTNDLFYLHLLPKKKLVKMN